jgi:hypothetical protein
MRRREFVKGMLAASVGAKSVLAQQSAAGQAAPVTTPATPPAATPAPGPVPWMRGLMDVQPLHMRTAVPDAFASASTRFFSDEQMATLRHLCEIMQPPLKGYPGAVDAGAHEFIDFLISVSPPDRQEMYRSGLDRLEREAKQKYSISFAATNASQADALLRPWLRAWMNDHPPTEPYEAFINLVHADIRTATMNSQEWNDASVAKGEGKPGAGLYWYPVEADVEQKYLPRA